MRAGPATNGKKNSTPALRALQRAAKRAVAVGRLTGTPVYVLDDKKIIDLTQRNHTSRRMNRKPGK